MSTAPVVLPPAKGGQPIYVPANTRSDQVVPHCFHDVETRRCRVPYSVFLMHRRKDLWGPDGECIVLLFHVSCLSMFPLAEEFDPDRFLDERLHKYLTPNPFIFVPFNAGPRICLGQQVDISLLNPFYLSSLTFRHSIVCVQRSLLLPRPPVSSFLLGFACGGRADACTC